VLGALLTSCQHSIEITKRRYKRGYHVCIGQRAVTGTIVGAKDYQCKQVEQRKEEVKKDEASVVMSTANNGNYSLVSKFKLQQNKKLKNKKDVVLKSSQDFLIKLNKPNITSDKNKRGDASPNLDDLFSYLLLFIILLFLLALIIPPLPIVLSDGEVSIHFWINLLITISAITFAFLGLFIVAIPLWIIAVGYSWWYIYNS